MINQIIISIAGRRSCDPKLTSLTPSRKRCGLCIDKIGRCLTVQVLPGLERFLRSLLDFLLSVLHNELTLSDRVLNQYLQIY